MATKKKGELDWKELEPIVLKNFFAASGKDPKRVKLCDCTGPTCECGFDIFAAYAAGTAGGAAGDLVGSNE